MPLVSPLGEQSLNASLGEDQPGNGVWLIRDSNYNLFGLVEEYRGAEFRLSAFFIQGDQGQVTARYELGADVAFNIVAYDQEAFLIYPVDPDDFESYPPVVLYAESPPYAFDGEVAEYPPADVFDGGALFSVAGGSPVSRATETSVANGDVRVYEAPDGDGTGIFVEVTDGDDNRIGGVVRVNDDIARDQVAAIVGGHDETFTVAWTQSLYDGAGAELYRAKTLSLRPNLELAAGRNASGVFAGDAGDYVTDLFFFDTLASETLSRERIVNFGANDILVTTVEIADNNGDGIVDFGRNKRLGLVDGNGDAAVSVTFAGVRSLEFDGRVVGNDGRVYYVYSRINSDADEHYLIT